MPPEERLTLKKERNEQITQLYSTKNEINDYLDTFLKFCTLKSYIYLYSSTLFKTDC